MYEQCIIWGNIIMAIGGLIGYFNGVHISVAVSTSLFALGNVLVILWR